MCEVLHASTGILRYSPDAYKLIVEVDPGIVSYYRWLLPRSIRTNRQMYAPHISVVRKQIPLKLDAWKMHEGELIHFSYEHFIYSSEVYFWLNVFSQRLIEIRRELGLSDTSKLSRPPDERECFHITVANRKGL